MAYENFLRPLAIVGALAILRSLTLVFLFLYRHFFRPSTSFTRFQGDWAVITGASAGIGAGFARQLAKKGLNVILMARSVDKLNAVADQVKKLGVEARVICFDFADASEKDYALLKEQLSGVPITVLVNNVGINVPFPTDFMDMSMEMVDRIVKVNIDATNKMTALLLPNMIRVKRGIIIFLSSGGGAVVPAPLLSPYAGTKAYNDAFAVSLSGEVVHKGISVQSLTPFFVESQMAKKKASLAVPSADAFAKGALSGVGREIRASPYWIHDIMAYAITSLPLRLQVSRIASIHRDIRHRALRKQARLAKKS